jgi:Probable Zinc-ribbon domain
VALVTNDKSLDTLYQILLNDLQRGVKVDWEAVFNKEKGIILEALMHELREVPVVRGRTKGKPITKTHSNILKIWSWANEELGIFPENFSAGNPTQCAIFNCPRNPKHPPYIKKIFLVANKDQDCPYCTNSKLCLENSFGYKNQDFLPLWVLSENSLTPFHLNVSSAYKATILCGDCKQEPLLHKISNLRNIRYCSNCKINNRKKSIVKKFKYPRLEQFYDSLWRNFSEGNNINWKFVIEKEEELIIEEILSDFKKLKKIKLNFSPISESHPKLINEQWHTKLNEGLGIIPEEVSAGSSQYAFFLCGIKDSNHPPHFSSIANKAYHNQGCPFCTSNKVCLTNSLGFINPDIALTWNNELNEGMNPFKITPGGSKVKYYWHCPECNNDKWYTSSNERKKYCSCNECRKGYSTSFPQHAIYFYLRQLFMNCENRAIMDGYEIDILLLLYSVGIEYNGEYYHRNKKKEDAIKRKALKDKIDLLIIKESDKKRFHNSKRQFVHKTTKGYGSKEYFSTLEECIKKCIHYILEKNHEISLKGDLDINIKRDQYIIQKEISFIVDNNIFQTHSYLKNHWNFEENNKIGLKPEAYTFGSNKPVYWKCISCGKEYERPIKTMCASDNIIGCDECVNTHHAKRLGSYQSSIRKVIKKDNILQTHPIIKEMWDYELNKELIPEYYRRGSSEKVYMKIKGKTRHITIYNAIKIIEKS